MILINDILRGDRFWLVLLAFWPAVAVAQDFSGRWDGKLFQKDNPLAYSYSLDLRMDGDLVSGTAASVAPDGAKARFTVAGRWDGQKLFVQELEQLEPPKTKWCLKYLVMTWSEEGEGRWKLTGNWQASGCLPGTVELFAAARSVSTPVIREQPFSIAGNWTGHLSQSDRPYGFYFEGALEENGAGKSFIVSEGNGGSAHHHLHWSFSDSDSLLTIEESAVADKTDPNWRWCIKRAVLKMHREGDRYTLTGNWTGHIEGASGPKSRCAPGTIYLEKPVLNLPEAALAARSQLPDSTGKERVVKIVRTIEVARPDIKIRLWDNGIEDGDIVSLFLNGQRIANRFRITKGKSSVSVKLAQENNFLVLYAEDLGSITPNTVAISIDDGQREQILVVSANLTESGAILIRQFSFK